MQEKAITENVFICMYIPLEIFKETVSWETNSGQKANMIEDEIKFSKKKTKWELLNLKFFGTLFFEVFFEYVTQKPFNVIAMNMWFKLDPILYFILNADKYVEFLQFGVMYVPPWVHEGWAPWEQGEESWKRELGTNYYPLTY